MATSLNWRQLATIDRDWKRLLLERLDRSGLMCRDGQKSI
jgi:hypothetical protein